MLIGFQWFSPLFFFMIIKRMIFFSTGKSLSSKSLAVVHTCWPQLWKYYCCLVVRGGLKRIRHDLVTNQEQHGNLACFMFSNR